MFPFPRTRPLALLALAAVLTTTAPAASQTTGFFGKNRIQYRDFEWKIYHSPHFDVYYYESEEHLLQKTVSFAESAYDELSRAFDYQIQDPTPLIVYQTHSAFLQNNIIVNGIPEGAQAFAVPSRFRMVLPLDIPDPELLALIKHELTHIFQYHLLFRGRLGAGLRGAPPQWFMEGMASYFADDEGPSDRKFMIDAVVNDRLPSVESQGGGFFAYRFGHAVFDFIEERWGRETILDLIYEYRNTLGSRIGRAIERTFRMDAEEFDDEFRRWARRRYLPKLLETGEPGDFGKLFRLEEGRAGQEVSPTASPSGDLIAAATTDRGEVDVSLFDARTRRRIKNLTRGLDTQIREVVVQLISAGRQVGRDLSFSPDGNRIAAFGRREEGRALILIDVLNGGLERIVEMDIEQQLSPAWTPDGRTVVFSGNLGGAFDIFALDLETNEIRNLTDDEMYDAAPVVSPDGETLLYTSYVGDFAQLFLLDLDQPTRRYQLTHGQHHSKEGIFSPDGKKIYFTSDERGVDNIYGIDLEAGTISQFTDSVTGCDRPTILDPPDGGQQIVYTGYWKGRFDLYVTDVEEPVVGPDPYEIPQEPSQMAELERFEPDIEVTIDEENLDNYGRGKFFLEDVQNFFGIDSNQIFVGRILLSFTDYLGDRRIFANVAAVDSFSDFDVSYVNLRNRWQRIYRIFDQRIYAVRQTLESQIFGTREFERDLFYRITGLEAALVYPFDFHKRVEFRGGYYLREYEAPIFGFDEFEEEFVLVTPPREDDYPQLSVAFVSDDTIYAQWGPISGHRLRIQGSYAPDFDDSGTLTQTVFMDARKYVPVTARSNLAVRLFLGASDGNVPDTFFIGGLDQIRGFNFREFSGFRAGYLNAEFRFPLVDVLAFPAFLSFQGIRGNIFFDIGTAYYPELNDFELLDDDDVLEDAVASYGYGFTLRFGGLSLNWDFAQRYDLDQSIGSYETAFWVGARF